MTPSTSCGLLAAADGKVRTLALLMLFDREEPRLLPQLAALRGRALGDEGLLGALGGVMPTADPDLALPCGERIGRCGGHGLRPVVLEHAARIFAPASAGQLLAPGFSAPQRAFGGGPFDVRWVTAVASLRP